MKYIRLILAVMVLFSLLQGCSQPAADNAPTFYYLNAEPEYGSDGSIIGSESRHNAEDNTQLRYLLALYFSGPIDSTLRSPFPKGSAILNLWTEETCLHLTMNGAFSNLSGVEMTKACACIALTVFDNSDAQSVEVHFTEAATGISRKLVFSRDSMVLHDEIMPEP